ncbi:MAG TPA: hypothetical protein GX702_05000 [Chloroflexi bacterium]|jgi:hypothetical protein|nr:hypothetical protein [Chloroflexota bacterium]
MDGVEPGRMDDDDMDEQLPRGDAGDGGCPGFTRDDVQALNTGLQLAITLARQAGRNDLARDLNRLATQMLSLGTTDEMCRDCGSELWLG